jgi:hypothetical protein
LLQAHDDEQQYNLMKENLLAWVAAWSSDSGDTKALDKVKGGGS